MQSENIKKIPSVVTILKHPEIYKFQNHIQHSYLVIIIRDVLNKIRLAEHSFSLEDIIKKVKHAIQNMLISSLKPVINATGIILHTNLGRAPINETVYNNAKDNTLGYCNLEFDLNNGSRGDRHKHLQKIIKFITHAEDVLIVNNNAAAVWLILEHFAKNKEVIVSRSELIEIGGSFRIPDIMSASGAVLKEIGTTNCTYPADYQKAINENTGLIFKAHQSNYSIKGHTTQVDVTDLAKIAKKHNIPFIYDIGSGLIKKTALINEPSVQDAIQEGADLVTFSGDKLLGGNQAGIIIGKSSLIKSLAKNPLMRVLRVDKITISLLEECFKLYLSDKKLLEQNLIFKYLSRSEDTLFSMSKQLSLKLTELNIHNTIVKSFGRSGGGTLPDLEIPSYAVCLSLSKKDRLAEMIYQRLLITDKPIVGILKEGMLLFDVLTLENSDFDLITQTISSTINES